MNYSSTLQLPASNTSVPRKVIRSGSLNALPQLVTMCQSDSTIWCSACFQACRVTGRPEKGLTGFSTMPSNARHGVSAFVMKAPSAVKPDAPKSFTISRGLKLVVSVHSSARYREAVRLSVIFSIRSTPDSPR